MKISFLMKSCLLILLIPLISLTGCGTTKSVYRASAEAAKSVSDTIIPGEAKLSKRVMVIPIVNNASIEERKINEITGSWEDYLKKDDKLLISLMGRSEADELEKNSFEYGITIVPELVKKAEEMDMDILITAVLNPFEVRILKKGIWPFRRLRKEVTISMTVNVLNICDGALVMSKIESRKVNLKDEIVDEQDTSWEINYEILDEELSDIMYIHSGSISDKLDSQPWTGKITMAEDRALMINGGKDIGISQSDIFEVFVKGEPIRGVDGKEYFILGQKIGEVRADEVMQKYSLVVPLNNEKYEDGQLVRLKR